MSRIAVTRTIYSLPGKRQQYLEYLDRTDVVRRKWGMLDRFLMEKVIDPHVLFLLEIWESREKYDAWKQSSEHSKTLSEGRQWRVREPSLLYRVLEEAEEDVQDSTA